MPTNLFDLIRNLFTGGNKTLNSHIEHKTFTPFDLEAYIAKKQQEAQEKVPTLERMFGTDFSAFFYRHRTKYPLTDELLFQLDLLGPEAVSLDNPHWKDKHPFNFPGPFYTGQTDTCGTGESEAPYNTLSDTEAMEFVFRQPQNYVELICVINAGVVEIYDGYSCNGNNHWTYSECRNWWSVRGDIINSLNSAEFRKMNGGREQRYIDYLNTTAENDLRKYCYFLENHFYPKNDKIALPPL